MSLLPPETTEYSVYCDESCHLQHDQQRVMVLGAVWCPTAAAPRINRDLRRIKTDFHMSPGFETKWTKVSPAALGFYVRCLDYFFSNPDLHFRVLVVPDKSKLDHDRFDQTHDEWYYKMYFEMLKAILSPSGRFRMYIDVKDTRGSEKIAKLHTVLCNSMYDFSHHVIHTVQLVRSHEVQLMQLTDLLVGAVAYANRGLNTSEAKLALVEHLRTRSGYSLTRTTLLREEKLNVFCWRANEVGP